MKGTIYCDPNTTESFFCKGFNSPLGRGWTACGGVGDLDLSISEVNDEQEDTTKEDTTLQTSS